MHVRGEEGQEYELLPFGRRREDILPLRKSQLFCRRALDLAGALLLTMLAAPLLLIIAVVVRVTSRGPILFRHERVGRGGKPFVVLKFRTMRVDTHEMIHSTCRREEFISNDFKLHSLDDQITSAGRFLRRRSLDELPQLFNVIRGDMSLVGIRPLVGDELRMRRSVDQYLYRRLRPGMTGLWQVSGRSSVKRQLRIAMDREYAASWSPRSDIRIIARTPSTVLRSHETA